MVIGESLGIVVYTRLHGVRTLWLLERAWCTLGEGDCSAGISHR